MNFPLAWLISAALLPLAASRKYSVPLERDNVYYKRNATNAFTRAFLDEHFDRHQRYLKARYLKDPRSQPFYDYYNINYRANVTVGTPPQQFRVVLDTGSADFWIPALDCQVESGGACDGKVLFNDSASSTFVNLGYEFEIRYGRGSVKGTTANETVGLGRPEDDKLVVPRQTFGVAHSIDDALEESLNFDGIVGLAFGSLSKEHGQPVFLNAVDQGLVDEPIFTIWLTKEPAGSEGKEGGLITYGGFDDKHCSNDIHYIPLADESYWIFEGQAFSVNGQETEHTYSAVTDSGTSYIAADPTIVQSIVDGLKAEQTPSGRYVLPCNSNFTIGFNINGKNYNIEAKNVLLENEEGSCDLTLQQFVNPFVQLILGDPFIREYCQVHDVKEGRVGFALAKQ
uniref:Aspartic peptidase ASP101 n=1 Tax=Bursaphelenchus xylophilus TaxID=6326 RepID=A0A514YAY5_BURXY|nr:aspartic peptidase ASP101 [Bursaphelenchus xylophilus]